MKIKCIKGSTYFNEGDIHTAEVDLVDLDYYDEDTKDSALIELYVGNVTVASVAYKYYKDDKIKSWYFDHYFKTHFEIIE